ncbi:MAG: MFS transporter [Alphaproteobacteria bacterium]
MAAIQSDAAPRDRLPYWFSAGHLCIDWPFGALYMIAPAAGLSFGWSPAQVGLLLTIQSIGASLAYLPAGLLMDRVSNRGRILMSTFFWVSFGYILASYAQGFWPLAIMMAVASMGDAAWHPMATGILVKAAPGQRARVLGIHAIGGAMAGVFAPLFASHLLDHGLFGMALDWRDTLIVVVLPTAVMGFLFLIHVSRQVPRVEPGTVARPDFRGLIRDWSTPFGAGLVAMMVLYNLGLIGATAMTPLFLQTDQGMDVWQAGQIFAGVLLVGAVLQPRLGRLADEVGRRPLIFAAAILSAIGGVIVYLSTDTYWIVGGLVLCLGALTSVRSVVLACAVDLSGRSEATTLGIAFAVLDGVGAFGAVLAGLIGETDLSRAYLMTAVCAGAAGIVAVMLPRRQSR